MSHYYACKCYLIFLFSLQYTLRVVDGHHSENDLYSNKKPVIIKESTFFRHLMAEGVQRIEIEEDNLRCILFTPPGNGPFPLIIDLFGAESGSKEFRSAMLASYGYASLVAPYYNYKDLPPLKDKLDLDYFLKAIDHVEKLPQINKDGVGLIGSSKGGEIGLALCTLTDKIKACITINPYHISVDMNYHYKNELYVKGIQIDLTTGEIYLNDKEQFIAHGQDKLYTWDHSLIIPVDKIPNDCEVLIAAGDQDGGLGHRSAIILRERARILKKDNISTIIYPEAGHLLDPPFHSHIEAVWNSVIQIRKPDGTKYKGLPHMYGGNPIGMTLAAKDLWYRTLALFHKKLIQQKGLPLNTCKLKPPYVK